MKKIYKFLGSKKGLFILGGLLGLVVFLVFFGVGVLDVTNDAWLLNNSGDLKQHYIGWLYYRESGWNFPLTVADGLAYPFGLSVVFMDSIPLFAIPFKLVSFILPATFQYFGWFGLVCFVLQGGIGALILGRFTKRIGVVLAGAVMLVVSPPVLMRVFGHTSLAAHWLILLAIYLLISWRDYKELKKSLVAWTIALVLAVLVHPYFVVMVGVLFMISIVVSHKDMKSTIWRVVVPSAIALMVFWAIGGFGVGLTQTSGGGLGQFGVNLLSIFDPAGWSSILQPIKMASETAYEGFNFLGVGVILLLPVVAYVLLSGRCKLGVKKWWRKNKGKTVLITVLVVGLVIAAIGPSVQLGSTVLFDLELPKVVEKVWSIFRATGRLFWPVYYLIVIGVLVVVIKSTERWRSVRAGWFLVIFAVLQLVDTGMSVAGIDKTSMVRQSAQSQERVIKEYDRELMAGYCDKNHLFILDSAYEYDDYIFGLFDVGVECGMTLNDGYFARSPRKEIDREVKVRYDLLVNGDVEIGDTLYITIHEEKVRMIEDGGYGVAEVGPYYVVKEERK